MSALSEGEFELRTWELLLHGRQRSYKSLVLAFLMDQLPSHQLSLEAELVVGA